MILDLAVLLAIVTASAGAGALLMKRHLDAAWRDRLRRREEGWARAFARIPQSARRHCYQVFSGGHDEGGAA